MSAPRTLNEAREQLEALGSSNIEISNKLAAYESNESLAAAGIVRVDDEKGVRFSVPRISELEATISELTGKVTLLELEGATLRAEIEEANGSLAASAQKITKLESSTKTAETIAREIVGNLGGAPLAVDSSQSLTSVDELRAGLSAEKDPAKKWELFKRIESMKKNGTQK